MKKLSYQPSSLVCCERIDVEIDDNDIIATACICGGCPGNSQAVGKLVTGLSAQKAISLLKGIRCGNKPTSCPDQLAQALEKILGK